MLVSHSFMITCILFNILVFKLLNARCSCLVSPLIPMRSHPECSVSKPTIRVALSQPIIAVFSAECTIGMIWGAACR